MLLLKAALLCSLYIPQVNLLTLGFSNIKESPSEVQSISGLAEYEYPLLEKLWTRIGAPHTSMQKQSNVIPLIHKTAASTRIAWIHTQVAKNPRGSGWTELSLLYDASQRHVELRRDNERSRATPRERQQCVCSCVHGPVLTRTFTDHWPTKPSHELPSLSLI